MPIVGNIFIERSGSLRYFFCVMIYTEIGLNDLEFKTAKFAFLFLG